MRARTSARSSVNTTSLFMCEHSVQACSARPAVRTRMPLCASVNAPLLYVNSIILSNNVPKFALDGKMLDDFCEELSW